jgi:hypothetical protein
MTRFVELGCLLSLWLQQWVIWLDASRTMDDMIRLHAPFPGVASAYCDTRVAYLPRGGTSTISQSAKPLL